MMQETPEYQPVPLVEVTAPTNLMEGFELETQIGDETVTVTVPEGGVEEGQTFHAPIVSKNGTSPKPKASGIATSEHQSPNVPVGHWKDSLFYCWRYGLCHASCCMSCWCTLLAVGQVITRMQLNWCGKPTSSKAAQQRAFTILSWIVICYISLQQTVLILTINPALLDPYSSRETLESVEHLLFISRILRFTYILFTFIIIFRVRRHVRAIYDIPSDIGETAEDCAVSCCFPRITTMQMLRHTGDYEHYGARGFSSNGLWDQNLTWSFPPTKEQELTVQHGTDEIV